MTKRALCCLLAIIAHSLAMSGAGSTSATSYSTSFSVAENPISEGGRWMNGRAVGLDWADVQTVSGRAVGTSSKERYSDPTAIVGGAWGPDQQVEATVYSRNPTGSYFQEVELRLRSSIAPHRNTGYEVLFRCLKTDSAYAQIVRWNGPLGSFTSLASRTGSRFGVRHGDVIKATVLGNVIKGYVNGVEVVSARDSTYSSGNPGMGFNFGVGATCIDFGFTRWSATDSLVGRSGHATRSSVVFVLLASFLGSFSRIPAVR